MVIFLDFLERGNVFVIAFNQTIKPLDYANMLKENMDFETYVVSESIHSDYDYDDLLTLKNSTIIFDDINKSFILEEHFERLAETNKLIFLIGFTLSIHLFYDLYDRFDNIIIINDSIVNIDLKIDQIEEIEESNTNNLELLNNINSSRRCNHLIYTNLKEVNKIVKDIINVLGPDEFKLFVISNNDDYYVIEDFNNYKGKTKILVTCVKFSQNNSSQNNYSQNNYSQNFPQFCLPRDVNYLHLPSNYKRLFNFFEFVYKNENYTITPPKLKIYYYINSDKSFEFDDMLDEYHEYKDIFEEIRNMGKYKLYMDDTLKIKSI